MRFGAMARSCGMNYVADSTFDEIRVYANPYQRTSVSSNLWIQQQYNAGRYYHSPAEPSAYISPVVEPHRVLGITKQKTAVLRSISWTCYWPDERIDGLPAKSLAAANQDEYPLWECDPVKKQWDPISIDVNVGGVWISNGLADDNAYSFNTPFTRPQGSRITRNGAPIYLKSGEGVRYKVYFNIATADSLPVQEAPILDDVTMYFTQTSPKVLAWQWIK